MFLIIIKLRLNIYDRLPVCKYAWIKRVVKIVANKFPKFKTFNFSLLYILCEIAMDVTIRPIEHSDVNLYIVVAIIGCRSTEIVNDIGNKNNTQFPHPAFGLKHIKYK